jgi:low temperature requirement protein LtrA
MGIEIGRRSEAGDGALVRPDRAVRRGHWLEPPRLRTAADEVDRRHATWLELFFDLVFVVAITERLPPLSTRIHRRVPTSASHVPDRWALFTVIVIGESVVAVAVRTAGTSRSIVSAVAAVLGFAAVAAAWWLYFDRQADVVLQGTRRSVVICSYAHLPLLLGLAATSAGAWSEG